MDRRTLLRAIAGGLPFAALALAVSEDTRPTRRSFVATLLPADENASNDVVGIASLSVIPDAKDLDYTVRLSGNPEVRGVHLYRAGDHGPEAYRSKLITADDRVPAEETVFKGSVAWQPRISGVDANNNRLLPSQFAGIRAELEAGELGLEVRGANGVIRGRFG